jgi:hypothetical protein
MVAHKRRHMRTVTNDIWVVVDIVAGARSTKDAPGLLRSVCGNFHGRYFS